MFCFWCQTGKIPSHLKKEGIVWIHTKCFMELSNFKSDIETIKKILLKEKNNETIEEFIKRMDKFDEIQRKRMNILKELGLL